MIVLDWGRTEQNSFNEENDIWFGIDKTQYVKCKWVIEHDDSKINDLIKQCKDNNWDHRVINLYP